MLRDGESLKGRQPKICYTYPTMMKLSKVIPYLKKIQNCINNVITPSVLLTSAFFHQKLGIFVISGNTDKKSSCYIGERKKISREQKLS